MTERKKMWPWELFSRRSNPEIVPPQHKAPSESPIFLNGEGGFCFISHSFYDFKKVREIRNILEEHGFNPLCFFLKCMTEYAEINDLLAREIEAREIFILAESENSRNSDPVQTEVAIARRLGRPIFTIDLDRNESPQILAERIMSRMRVFISYSSRNMDLVNRIKSTLIRRNLRVFFDEDLSMIDSIEKNITDALLQASQYGCVLLILTPESVRSEWIYKEIKYALMHHARILPLFVGDINLDDLDDRLQIMLCTFYAMHISAVPSEAELHKVCDRLHAILGQDAS